MRADIQRPVAGAVPTESLKENLPDLLKHSTRPSPHELMLFKNSGDSATPSATTESTTAITSSRSPICFSSKWRMSADRSETVSLAREKGKAEKLDCSWRALADESGNGLTEHYIDALRALGQQKGLLGEIYTQAQSRFQQSGQPQEANQPDRRNGVDRAGHRC